MKVKLTGLIVVTAVLNFILLFFSKDILGDSLQRFVIRDMILTSFYFVTSLAISFIIMLFFNNRIFRLWLKRFMVWFVPVSVLIIASGSVEISYAWPTRTSLAINMGVIMTIATLLFALVQRFYYKIK